MPVRCSPRRCCPRPAWNDRALPRWKAWDGRWQSSASSRQGAEGPRTTVEPAPVKGVALMLSAYLLPLSKNLQDKTGCCRIETVRVTEALGRVSFCRVVGRES